MENATRVIIKLLRDPQGFCPFRDNDRFSTSWLFSLATRNKVEYILFHFLTCVRCRSNLSERFLKQVALLRKRSIVYSILYEHERRKADELFEKIGVRAVQFKYCADVPIRGTDLDLLVSKIDFPLIISKYSHAGYQVNIIGRSSKEAHLISPLNHFEIDLHFLVAYPHYGQLDQRDARKVEEFTQQCLLSNTTRKAGIMSPSVEWYIMSKIVLFWHNDLLVGIGSLYDLSRVCRTSYHHINWINILAIADANSIRNETLFVLLLASRFFNFPLPVNVQKSASFRTSMFAQAQTVGDIVVFPPMQDWYHKRYSKIVREKHLRYHLLRLLLNSQSPPARLIRPKVLVFLIRSILRSLTNRNFLATVF